VGAEVTPVVAGVEVVPVELVEVAGVLAVVAGGVVVLVLVAGVDEVTGAVTGPVDGTAGDTAGGTAGGTVGAGGKVAVAQFEDTATVKYTPEEVRSVEYVVVFAV